MGCYWSIGRCWHAIVFTCFTLAIETLPCALAGSLRSVSVSPDLPISLAYNKARSPFSPTTPSGVSWGAVFFPETWMEYRLYLAARLQEDHLNVQIKGSKTNK